MKGKGYAKITPTKDQVQKIKTIIEAAEDFIDDQDAQDALVVNHCKTVTKRHWLFWKKEVRLPPNKFVMSALAPYGVSFIGIHLQHASAVFDFTKDYYNLQSLMNLIEVGGDIYLDNYLSKCWNDVQQGNFRCLEDL